MSVPSESRASNRVSIELVIVAGKPEGSVCKVEQGLSVVGSGKGCDIKLGSPEFDGAQAAVVRFAGGAFLCDLCAPGGIRVNEQPTRWIRLSDGDEIAIGSYRMKAQVRAPAEYATIEQPVFSLKGDDSIGVVSSEEPVLVVGSHPSCDFVLDSDHVQPRHCVVVWTDDGPLVRDLSEDARTRVNGCSVRTGQVVDGDSIGVGPYELIFKTEIKMSGDATPSEALSGDAVSMQSDESGVDGLLAGSLKADQILKIEDLWGSADMSRPGARQAVDGPDPFAEIITSAEEDLSVLTDTPLPPAMPTKPEPANGKTGTKPAAKDESESQPASKENPKQQERIQERRIMAKTRRLEEKTNELKQRVAAAQGALDLRARKHRESLDRERDRLKQRRSELQRHAQALLAAAQEKTTPEPSIDEVVQYKTEPNAEVAPSAPMPVRDEKIEQLLSGDVELAESAEFNERETFRATGAPLDLDDESLKTLEERVAELVNIAKIERKEIERGEAMVESLRFETERQRTILGRRREKMQARETALEDRFKSLVNAREAVRRDRLPLLNRLKELDSEERSIRTRLEEGERLHRDLVNEAETLDAAQETLETRERELLNRLEMERQRLQVRQTELQKKAAKLAKSAREKRMRIEADVSIQQAEIEAREAELRARRIEIDEAARGELERTANELETVLNVRLTDIEADLLSRQADLDARVRELSIANQTIAVSPINGSVEQPLRKMAAELAAIGRTEETDASPSPQLDELEQEIEALSRSGSASGTEDSPETAAPDRMVSDQQPRLDERKASLRMDKAGVPAATGAEANSAAGENACGDAGE